MAEPVTSHLPLVAVVGPTATGKSALALALALRFGGEVINADSRQVYRGLEVGTATPSPEERALVPHHLYGSFDPDRGFSLAGYLSVATEAIKAVHGRGRLPVLVGGTGQYVWGLLEGWQVPRVPPDPALRRRLSALAEAHGHLAVYRHLQESDPETAARIDPRNVRRVIRALEVHRAAGATRPGRQRRLAPPYRTLVLGLTTPTRADLHRRIDERVKAMIDAGWLDEVRRLREEGLSPDLPSMSSLGYREMARHLAGELSLEEAVRLTAAAHRQLARRQYTWFKRSDPRIRWLDTGLASRSEAEALVRGFLAAAAEQGKPPTP